MAVCGGGGFVGIVVDRLDLGSRGAGLEPAKAKVGGVTEAKRAGDGGGEVEFQSEPEPLGRLYATAGPLQDVVCRKGAAHGSRGSAMRTLSAAGRPRHASSAWT